MSSKKKTGGSLGGAVVRRVEPQGEVEQCRKLIELHAVGNKVCFGPWVATANEAGRLSAEVAWAAMDVFELTRWKRAVAAALAREAQSLILRKNFLRHPDVASAAFVQAFIVGVASESNFLINSVPSSIPRLAFLPHPLHPASSPGTAESRGRGLRDSKVRHLHENFHASVAASPSRISVASPSLREFVVQMLKTSTCLSGSSPGSAGKHFHTFSPAHDASAGGATPPSVVPTLTISGEIGCRADIAKTASRVLREGELRSGCVVGLGASWSAQDAAGDGALLISGREEAETVKTAVFEVEFTTLMLKHAELFAISSDTPTLRPRDDPHGERSGAGGGGGGGGGAHNRPRRPPTGVSPEDQALRRTFLSSLLSAFRHGQAWDAGEEETLAGVLKAATWETSAFAASSLFPSMPSLASSPVASPQPGAVFPVSAAGGGAGGMLVNWNFAAVVFGLQQGAGRGGRPEFSKSAIQCERKLKTKPELLDETVTASPRVLRPMNLARLQTGKSAKDLFVAAGAALAFSSRPVNLPPNSFLALERRGAITKKPVPVVATDSACSPSWTAPAACGRRRRWTSAAETLDALDAVRAPVLQLALEEKVQSGLVECMIEKKRVASLSTPSIAFAELLVAPKSSSPGTADHHSLQHCYVPTLQAAEELVKAPAPRMPAKKPGRADKQPPSTGGGLSQFPGAAFGSARPNGSATPPGVAAPAAPVGVPSSGTGPTALLGLMQGVGVGTTSAPMQPSPSASAQPKRKFATKSEGGLSIAALNSSAAATSSGASFGFKQGAVKNPPNIPPVTIPPVQIPQGPLPPLPPAAGAATSSTRPARRATLVKKEKN